MTLQLKPGKSYLNACNEVITISEYTTMEKFPYSCSKHSYSDDGKSWEPGYSLVREVTQEELTQRAIPHADLIRKALDGVTIQGSSAANKAWFDYPASEAIRDMVSCPGRLYREKPKTLIRYCPVVQMPAGTPVVLGARIKKDSASDRRLYEGSHARSTEWQSHDTLVAVIRLELDQETLAVISAVTEEP